jgi:hypothetical protein
MLLRPCNLSEQGEVTTVSGLAFEYVGDDQGYRITVEAMEFSAAGVTF